MSVLQSMSKIERTNKTQLRWRVLSMYASLVHCGACSAHSRCRGTTGGSRLHKIPHKSSSEVKIEE
jgi:hypothetical protein